MKYLLLDPDITPSEVEMMDGQKIESVTDKQLYGYETSGYIVQEPGMYYLYGEEEEEEPTLVKIDVEIGADCTEEFWNTELAQEYFDPDDPDTEVHASSCTFTIEGITLTYFVHIIYTSPYGPEEYYFMTNGVPEVYLDLVIATEDDAIYTGTYHLSNGSDVVITGFVVNYEDWPPRLDMVDADGTIHSVTTGTYVQYFKTEGFDDLYYCSDIYPNLFTYNTWFERLPNGRFKALNSSYDKTEFPAVGQCFAYHYFQDDEYIYEALIYDSTFTFRGTLTVLDSAGTPTQVTFTGNPVYRFEYGDEKAYLIYNLMGNRKYAVYTGTTMDSLEWCVGTEGAYSSNPWGPYPIVIMKIKGIPSENVVLSAEPTVAFVENSDDVYYNAMGVPIYCEPQGKFKFVEKSKIIEFTYRNEMDHKLDYVYPSGCPEMQVLPSQVEKLEMKSSGDIQEWIDITDEFKTGRYYAINLVDRSYRDREDPNWTKISNGFRVTFTDEFLMSGYLTIYEGGCN